MSVRPIARFLALAAALLLAARTARAWSSADLAAEAATADHPGEAAVAAHRAALLDPRAIPTPVHPSVAAPLPPHVLAGIFTTGLAIGAVGIGWIAVSGRRRTALALAVLGLSTATAAAVPLERLANARDLAVVMDETPVRPSPATAAPSEGTLLPGTPVLVDGTQGDFVRVVGASEAGWVPRAALTWVVPPAT